MLAGFVLVLVAQLVQVQIINHGFYSAWALEQYKQQIVIVQPPRGMIRDRNGYLLAGNSVMYSVEADTRYVKDVEELAAELGALLPRPAVEIERLLKSSDDPWVVIGPPVSKEVGEQVASRGLSGITVRSLWTREYPEGHLASHALGFCNAEDECFYGVEAFYDSILRPEEPEKETDPVDEEVLWAGPPVVFPKSGADLVLTLDRAIQMMVEEELARAVQEYQADGGTIIVMDPRTFGILAMASLPDYDPGRYYESFGGLLPPFEDPAVSQQYEPGSVFKVVTVAAALDSGLVTPGTVYYDQGEIEVGGRVIKNASRRAYGEQTVTDILVKSLNVGAAWLSTQMGPDTFYRYAWDFGFGQLTDIDLAGEVSGQVWLPGDIEHWHDSNLGTNSFGQGLAVTPLQMVTAFTTVANDGVRLRPHIVERRIDPDGAVFFSQPMTKAQPISQETARQLMEMMVRVVEEGTPAARVTGYRVAGKTGTAQIPVPGGYDKEVTIVTFVGFGPVPDPEFVILVRLDRPRTSTWAEDTAAAAFSRLASRLFVVCGVPPGGATGADGG
jgi:cell division protein FtsI/penicillin-binding protein 2